MFSCKEDNRRRSGLRQDYLVPQMDIDTSQIDELFIDSSLLSLKSYNIYSNKQKMASKPVFMRKSI